MPGVSIQQRKDRRTRPWVVRYEDGPRHHSRAFATKAEAKAFAAQTVAEQAAGDWISPDAGKVLLADWCRRWQDAYVGRASSTQARAASVLRAHVVPRLGQRRLRDITRFDVERFVNEVVASGRSPATAHKVLRVLSQVLAAAVDARLLRVNPCTGVRAPKAAARHLPVFLTPAEVELLAAVILAPFGLLVRFAAYTGLRWGELAALQVGDVDLLRRTVRVTRSLERGGTVKDTKTHSGRVVHLEPGLADDVAAHIAGLGGGHDAWLFPRAGGGPLDYPNFRARVWRPAVLASGLDPSLRFHDLRHTCASWLIARGGTARAVMQWMGHSTVRVTFDRYGHLFPHELEGLAAKLGEMRSSPDAWGTGPASLGRVIALPGAPT